MSKRRQKQTIKPTPVHAPSSQSIAIYSSYSFYSINGKSIEQSVVVKRSPSSLKGEVVLKKNGEIVMNRPIKRTSDITSATKDARKLLMITPQQMSMTKTAKSVKSSIKPKSK